MEKLLNRIIRELSLNPATTDYFDLDEPTRQVVYDTLWDEVYSEMYRDSYETLYGPIGIELDIHTSLDNLLLRHEELENYEVCDLLKGLLQVTPHKIHQIDLEYATNNTKSRR